MRTFSAGSVIVKVFYFYPAFWFVETPIKLFKNLLKLILALEHFLSLTLMIKTFFRPWRNERRKGYIAYAVGIAVVVRLLFIILDIAILSSVVVVGSALIILFMFLPVFGLFFLFF